MSKNPLERAWPQWDQRRLSNRREQILHFDLSRKGREAITSLSNSTSRHVYCLYSFLLYFDCQVRYDEITIIQQRKKEREREKGVAISEPELFYFLKHVDFSKSVWTQKMSFSQHQQSKLLITTYQTKR